MKKESIRYGDNIVTMTGEVHCTKADCPYIDYAGCCTDINENCEYKQRRNDAFLCYTFDGISR